MIYLNNKLIEPTMFPDNTSQVWKLPLENLNNNLIVLVRWQFSHEGEFLHLAQLKALLDNECYTSYLIIEYLPYARQDKFVDNNATFALYPFASLLNSLKFFHVEIVDPHSSIATELIKHSHASYPERTIFNVRKLTDNHTVCYPDKGALDKYSKVYNFQYVYGEKIRDQSTGNILSYSLIGDVLNQNILIVDDICDGGMTFILLAKELLKAGAKEVNLFVTHGIFSKGIKVLKEAGIKRVFTQDGEVEDAQNGFMYRRI